MSLETGRSIPPQEAGMASHNRENEMKLHPLRELTLDTNYVRGFFNNVLTTSKSELPWLMQKEDERRRRTEDSSKPLSKKDILKRYMYGLYDAYVAIKSDEKGINLYPNEHKSAVDRFRDHWDADDMSDHLLGTVKHITKGLDEERKEALADPEKIEPYDVLLAERRAKRLRASMPKKFRDLFTTQSGIDPDNLPKKIGQKVSTLFLAGASAYSVDAVALGTGSGGVALTDHLSNKFEGLKNLNGWWIVAADALSYGGLAWGIGKNIAANIRLKRETGMSTNIGFAAGDATAQVTGADEEATEDMAKKGQISGEILKEVPWWISLGLATAAGALTPREVGIFVFWANNGGTLYSLAEAKAINLVLDKRRGSYNRRHPFVPVEEQDANIAIETSTIDTSIGVPTLAARKIGGTRELSNE